MESQRVAASRMPQNRELPIDLESDAMEANGEGPTADIVKIECEGDPEVMLAILAKKAKLAPLFRAHLDAILAAHTFADDWKEFDGIMCLKSAGAERVGREFPIQFFDVRYHREEWTDALGKAYRFVYEGRAAMGGHIIYAIGAYGTRDPFLGKKDKELRAIEEINPTTLQNAAYHIFCGNSIKALLGLRGIPVKEWEQMMARTGRNGAQATKVEHGKGTQGGTTREDSAKQKELAEICLEIANAGKIIVASEDFKTFTLDDSWESNDPQEVARDNCIRLSTFIGQGGKKNEGLEVKSLKGGRLEITLRKARDLKKQLGTQA